MKLVKVLEGIDYELIEGSLEVEISDICYDSRKVCLGSMFVALKGIDVDGHEFVKEAMEKGCSCVVISDDIEINSDITVLKVRDTRKDLARLSANFFEHPADSLIKIGITGTKGKTTVSWMIKRILEEAGYKVGVIGTIGTSILGKMYEHKNTTPESYELQKYLRMMVDSGIKYLVMEVSSQALKVGRIGDMEYDYALFTNLSIDHIGKREHCDYEDYASSKAKLFERCKVAIVNKDDIEYQRMVEKCEGKIYTYGQDSDNDLSIAKVDYCSTDDFLGIELKTSGMIEGEFWVSVPGKFSAYNAMSAIMVGNLLGVSLEKIKTALRNFRVEGRCEIFSLERGVKVIVDYAHNKISMESIIRTMKEYKRGRVVSVFGCGGGRSYERRFELGEMSGKYADFSIVTTDNPRNDEVSDINKDIVCGIVASGGKYIVIEDREEAIRYAIEKALENDIILLLGKGHEKYQEIKGKRYSLDEKEIVNSYLS